MASEIDQKVPNLCDVLFIIAIILICPSFIQLYMLIMFNLLSHAKLDPEAVVLLESLQTQLRQLCKLQNYNMYLLDLNDSEYYHGIVSLKD